VAYRGCGAGRRGWRAGLGCVDLPDQVGVPVKEGAVDSGGPGDAAGADLLPGSGGSGYGTDDPGPPSGGVGLTAAQGRSMEQDTLFHELLRELMRASGLVRRIGVNLNQAVAKLNATGQRSGDLVPYAAESFRRGERLDAVAEEIRKALR